MQWQRKGGTYLVRFIHIELIEQASNCVPSCPIKVGDRVRVKPSVEMPKYKWGYVTHRSIGVVTSKLDTKEVIYISKWFFFKLGLFSTELNIDSLHRTQLFLEQNRLNYLQVVTALFWAIFGAFPFYTLLYPFHTGVQNTKEENRIKIFPGDK